MNNIEIKLTELINIIRKDTGINNVMDAIEQLSAILLLQYFYKIILFDLSEDINEGSLKNLFFDFNQLNNENTKPDFFKFKNIFRDIFNKKNSCLNNEDGYKIEYLLDNIPFRIRSTKILEILLSNIENININKQLAEAYDELLIKMINESSAAGAFHSPKVLVDAIIKVINPSIEQTIYDPALGTGRFIIGMQKNLLKSTSNKTEKVIRAYGQDISPFACLVGSLNLLLNGIDIKNISLGDSLLDKTIFKYDIILSAIPFGKISNISKYEYNDNEYASNLETMFLKLTIEKLANDGKAALIVPNGLLFNTNQEFLNLRKDLLTKVNLHSILSLPANTLLPFSGTEVSVLFFNNNKIENDIWFYELRTDKPLSKANQLQNQDLLEFIELFPQRIESLNSYLVSKENILNKSELNLSIEVSKKTNEINNLKISDEIALLQEKKQEFDGLLSEFINLFKENMKVNFEKIVTLGELFTIKSGRPLKSIIIKKEGRYPVYGGNGIMGYYDEYNQKGENIIIGRVGAYCGNIHFAKEPVWLTNNSFSININPSVNVHLPYLVHVLRSLDLNKLARGSAQPAISYSKIKDIRISLPSYDQQVELSKWFEKIQMRNKDLRNLLELQVEKMNALSNYSIISNCIQKNN